MKVKFWFILGATLLTTLLLSGIVLAAGVSRGETASSVKITVEGEDPITGAEQGDVIHEGDEIDGECSIPNVTIEMSGDVSKVRVGMDDTCNLVVEEVVFSAASSWPDEEDETAAALAHTWRVQALAKVVGYASIDDLTKTKSSVKFKMDNYNGGVVPLIK